MAEKVFTYMFVTLGILVLFQIAGLVPDLGGTLLGRLGLTNIDDLQGFAGTSFMIRLLAAIAAITGLSAIIIGSLGRANFETSVAGGFATAILVYFVYSLGSVSYFASQSSGASWVGAIMFAIGTPLIVAFGLSIFDWVRGRD